MGVRRRSLLILMLVAILYQQINITHQQQLRFTLTLQIRHSQHGNLIAETLLHSSKRHFLIQQD